jgi:hypothetical protein
MIDFRVTLGVGLDGIDAACLGTRSSPADDCLVWADRRTPQAFDALGGIDTRPSLEDRDRIDRANEDARVCHAVPAQVGDDNRIGRASFAAYFNHVDKRFRNYFLPREHGCYIGDLWIVFPALLDIQATRKSHAFPHDGSLAKDAAPVMELVPCDDLVGYGLDLVLRSLAIDDELGDLGKDAAPDIRDGRVKSTQLLENARQLTGPPIS